MKSNTRDKAEDTAEKITGKDQGKVSDTND